MDANGSLYSSTIFDYETNATQYAIQARALDEANASVEGNFTVSLLNVVEDLDGDGVEDFYDLDDDGDGYSDAEEVAYGSDLRDAASVANAQPVGLSAVGGLQIMENQSVGTLVGVLSATDADTDDLLRYELLGEKEIREIIGLYWMRMEVCTVPQSLTTRRMQRSMRFVPVRWMRQMQVWRVTSR